jgi:hypothetical protein
MNKNRRGTLSEKRAICYFIEKGLDVFDSCQDTGAVDMITFNPVTEKQNVGKLSLKILD